MRDEVVLIIPAGRYRTLSLLIPHLVACANEYDRCELWMNACWEAEDEHYIRSIVRNKVGKFLLKDDNQWHPNKTFQGYYRYYKTIGRDDTIYIKLDDDIVWMTPGSISKMVAARKENPDPLLIVGNTVNNSFCNFKHQQLGTYDSRWRLEGPYDYSNTDNYDGHFAEFAHETLIRHIRSRTVENAYTFADCYSHDTRLPNHVYAAYGHDITWEEDDEATPTGVLATKERPVMVIGSPLFAHYSYGDQWAYMDKHTDVLKRYRELTP